MTIQRATGSIAQSFAARGLEGDAERVQLVLLVLGGLIVATSMAQLGAAWLVGAREHARDIALLASIGMTPRQLQQRAAMSAGTVGVLSWLLAIPLGAAALQVIGNRAVARVGLGSGVVQPVNARTIFVVGVVVITTTVFLGAASATPVTRGSLAKRLHQE